MILLLFNLWWLIVQGNDIICRNNAEIIFGTLWNYQHGIWIWENAIITMSKKQGFPEWSHFLPFIFTFFVTIFFQYSLWDVLKNCLIKLYYRVSSKPNYTTLTCFYHRNRENTFSSPDFKKLLYRFWFD